MRLLGYLLLMVLLAIAFYYWGLLTFERGFCFGYLFEAMGGNADMIAQACNGDFTLEGGI